MHIGINCRSFLKRHSTGIGRYTYNLVRSLAGIDQSNQYTLYTSKTGILIPRRFPRVQKKNFSIKQDWFKRGPKNALKSIDLYHAPSPEFIPEDWDAKLVVTIHDLVYKAFPQGHTPETLELTEQQVQSLLPKAAKIICISESTRNDLIEYFKVDESKLRLIYQGVDKKVFYSLQGVEQKRARARIRARGIKKPFILSVGTIEPRKNLNNLLHAFSHLKNKHVFHGTLVVIGMQGWKCEALEKQISHLGLKNDVQFVGFVADGELRAFYNEAEAFVFPSFYEGFGYPILESMSCGAAVVVSNASSCPEVAGDAALQVNPYDPKEIAGGIQKVLEDKKFNQALREKALRRAEDFSYLKTAQETLKVYRQIYES